MTNENDEKIITLKQMLYPKLYVDDNFIAKNKIDGKTLSVNNDGILSANYSNENLLINPDFKINQRAGATYTGNVYTVDHWYTRNNGTGVITPLESGVKLLRTGGGYAHIGQFVDAKGLSGKTVTFTAKYKGTAFGLHVYPVNTDMSFGTKIKSTGFNASEDFVTKSVTIQVTDLATAPYLYFDFEGAAGNELVFEWVKLELGSAATPFVPPEPAAELAKCQRFYKRYPRTFATSLDYLSDMVMVIAPITPMREGVTPTATLIGSRDTDYWLATSNGGYKVDVAKVASYAANVTGNHLCVVVKTNNLTISNPNYFIELKKGFEISAEINP